MYLAIKLFAMAGLFKAQGKVSNKTIITYWAVIVFLLEFMMKSSFSGMIFKTVINVAIVWVALLLLEKVNDLTLEWFGIVIVTAGIFLFI